ncbi:MAG TPA: hypothetical protein VL588_05065 [Bdellovibrionota bacterium]|jgi:hypothetical protein|nr:hypothetical protein [Bdellovibrionota bacterium]
MWDYRGSYGPFAYGYRYRRGKYQRRRADLPKLRFTRVEAEVRPEPRGIPIQARLLLAELYPKAVFVFTRMPFAPGTEISVTFSWPRQFFLKGRVVACSAVGQGRIIRSTSDGYRLAIALEFESDTDRFLAESHILELRSKYVFV